MRMRTFAAAVAAVLLVGTAPAVAQQKSTWEQIKERGSLRVGVAQAEPWAFRDPLKQQWTGIAVSYGKALAEAMNVKIEFVEVTWGTAVAALQSNRIDIMPNLSVTPERAMAIEYTNVPVSYSALAVLIPANSPIESWDQLDSPSITIGVNQGSSQDSFITKRLPKAKILRFSSYAEVMAAYQNGNVNAATMYHPTLALLGEKVGNAKVILPKPVRLNFSDTALRREPDKTLRDWLATANNFYYQLGTTQEWYEEFLVSRGLDPRKSPAIMKEMW